MDEEGVDAYNVSQASYGSGRHHKKLLEKGYKKDEELSSDRHSVYSKDGRAIIGYRGTVIGDTRDLKADVAIAGGRVGGEKSFLDAEDVYKKVGSKYKGGDVLLSGHSLGGSKSIHVAKKYGVKKSFAFNPGTGVFGTKGGDTIVYNTKGDPISSRIKSKNVRFVKTEGLNPHSLDNYEEEFNKRPSVSSMNRRSSIWAMQNTKY